MARPQKRQLPVLGAAVACAASPQGQKSRKSRKLNEPASVEPVVPKSEHVQKLERAAGSLRPGLPKGGLLPCRAPERRKITTHLRAGVEQGGSTQVLYVSGMPGTGKTAIVLEALDKLKSQSAYTLVHVNAMRLGAPVQVFREIADQLQCETNNNEACSDLTEFFQARKAEDPVVVLLIDEVDCLVTPTQAVLYKVFDWLGMPNARLVLAAISNTMDLPERLLPRVASRFDIERVDFTPYNRDQIMEILCSRLKGQNSLGAFGDADSACGLAPLRLCAARVAAASGDVRKALQVCRRAVETRLQTARKDASNEGPVTIADLTAAEKELIFANPNAQAILGISIKARRFLSAMVIELRRKDSDVVVFKKVVSRFAKLLAIVENRSERGEVAGERTTIAEINEMYDAAEQLVLKLEAMNILKKEAELISSTESACGGPILSLGSLDIEDLSNTLLKVEDDPTLRELIEGGVQPGAEAARIFKHVD